MREQVLNLFRDIAPFVAVEADLLARRWRPGEPLALDDIDPVLYPALVTVAVVALDSDVQLVEDCAELIKLAYEHWLDGSRVFNPPSYYNLHSSIIAIKHGRGEPLRVLLGPQQAQDVAALVQAWQATPRRLSGRKVRR